MDRILGWRIAALLLVATLLAPDGDAAHDWPRFGFDVAGSNSSTAPAGISAGELGKLRAQQITLPGTVDASAMYLHGVSVRGAKHDVFFVTTSYGITVAIDADSGTILWQHSPAGYAGWAGTAQVTTATPAADASRAFIYAANPGGAIEKLSVSDGTAAWSTAVTLLPNKEKIASAINVYRGRVIATTGGYIGDAAPYQGHVAILDGTNGKLLSVWNSLCSDKTGLMAPSSCGESGSAIWGRTGAVVDTTTGNLLVATGNGLWDGTYHWGDGVIELDPDASRILGAYTPTNTDELDSSDRDLGSSSPVLIDGWVVQTGKDGDIRLLDWKKFRTTPAHKGGETQIERTPSGAKLFASPAVWRSGGATWMFLADNGGTGAFTFANGKLEPKWKNANGGTSPVIAGGLVRYVYESGGHLRVYEPATGAVLATLDCGKGHWNSPIVVDGRIAMPEGSSNSHATSGTMTIWRVK